MSMFIERLSLFGSFTLDLVIRVNKLFLECDVTKSSGSWINYHYPKKACKITINFSEQPKAQFDSMSEKITGKLPP